METLISVLVEVNFGLKFVSSFDSLRSLRALRWGRNSR